MRAEKLMRNTVVGVIAQTVASLTGVITHLVFVNFMITEYLGARGLFSSILEFLSLAELGIGTVLVYSMYKPIVDRDEQKLIALTQFYRRAYNLIALMVFGLGMCLMPFLSFFIDDINSVPHATLIYFLYLVSSASSYFLVYKQSILNADQQGYIINLYGMIFSIIQCVVQVIFLVTTHNFFAFLISQIVLVLAKNLVISKRAEKLYPFLKCKDKIKLSKEEKSGIYKNVFAMFNHRVGATVLSSTDSLLISKFIGLIYCGFYLNFKMIINLMNSFLNQFFNAMLSSVGNLTTSESKEDSYNTFKYLHFLGFWVYTFCTVSFIELANPVILALFGDEKYTFGFNTVLMIGVNFYVVGIRKVPLTFKEAMGLLWYDRYKPLIESLLNIVISVVCIQRMGIAGIFFGTILSMVATSLWVEPYVLFKHGFEMSMKSFWRRNFVYFFFSGVLIVLVHFIDSQFVAGLTGWADVFAKLGVCLLVPNVIIAVCFCFTKEFRNLFATVFSIFRKKISRSSAVVQD